MVIDSEEWNILTTEQQLLHFCPLIISLPILLCQKLLKYSKLYEHLFYLLGSWKVIFILLLPCVTFILRMCAVLFEHLMSDFAEVNQLIVSPAHMIYLSLCSEHLFICTDCIIPHWFSLLLS